MRDHVSMLIVTTGDGKGKTTAAIGQAIRAIGHGKKVFFAQFVKCDNYPSGEDEILRKFAPRLTFLKGGRGFVGILGDKLPIEEHRAAALETLRAATEAVRSGDHELIILDEVNVALGLKLINFQELSDFLDAVPTAVDVVLTGRGADPKIVHRADFVTDCVEVKHPFNKKVKAKKGIEY
jgi:cob(I)alamin adenosyltransferase